MIVDIIEHSQLFQSNLLRQFFKFGIVGFSNTLLSYLLYLLFLKLFENHQVVSRFDYIISSVITFFICSIWSFYWNNRVTFKRKGEEKRDLKKTYIKMVLSYSLTGLFLHNTMLFVLVEFWSIPKEIVPILILIVTVPLNFLLNKYWAFRVDS